MIPRLDRQRIQSEAYEKIVRFVDSKKIQADEEFAYIVAETTKKLEAVTFDASATLHELDRTRWARLQNTQFVYWAKNGGHPSITPTVGVGAGHKQYLIEQTAHYHLELRVDILEALKLHEQELWATNDDAVVYWRGWRIIPDPDKDSVFVRAEYCIAHIWDEQVHTDARDSGPARQDPWFITKLHAQQREARENPHRHFNKQVTESDLKVELGYTYNHN